MLTRDFPRPQWLLRLAVLFLAYYAGGRLGLTVPYVGSYISLIWLPAGFALAALLRWELSLWPAIALASFAVNLSVGGGPALAAGIACGNTAGTWLAAYTLRRLKVDSTLPTRQDQLLYLGIGVLGGMALNAGNGVLQLWLAGRLPAPALPSAWTVWWLGDAMGALVAGLPLLTLRWRRWRDVHTGSRRLELGLVFLFTLAVGHLVFLRGGAASPVNPLLYLPFLLLCHLAVRGGPGHASGTALLLSAQALWATVHGAGPFQAADVHTSLALLWGYMATAALIAALLSALTEEMHSSEQRFRQMFESNRSVKLIIDPADGRIEDANAAACSFYGYPRAQLLALRISDLNVLAPQEIEQEVALAQAQRRLYCRFRHRLASGALREVEVYSGPLGTRQGERLYCIVHDVTERNELEAELRKFQLFSQYASDAHLLIDARSRIRYANAVACARLGYGEAEILALGMADIEPGFDLARMRACFEQRGQGRMPPLETVHRARDGTVFPVEVSATALHLKGEWLAFTAWRDISERKEAESKLRLAASVFSNTHEGVMICDAHRTVLDVNPVFTQITGYAREEIVGRSPRQLSSGRHDEEFYRAMWQRIDAHGFWEGEIWNRRKDGSVYPARLSISSVRTPQGRISHYIAVTTDISRLKEHQAQLEFLAHYDVLTRLPNRALLSDRMAVAFALARRSGQRVAVCYLDLDGFKPINDELGHAAGDGVLVEVARRLQHGVRDGDTVARLGGDEFVLLLVGLAAARTCEDTVTRVLRAIAEPIALDGGARRVSASIGVALFPDDGGDPDTLLRHADQAMYRAKRTGKDRYQRFDAALI